MTHPQPGTFLRKQVVRGRAGGRGLTGGDGPAPDRGRRAPPAGLLERRAFLLVAAPGVTGPAAFQPGLPCTCLSLCSPGAIVPDELGGLDKTG